MSTANDIAMTDIEKGLSIKLTEDNDNIPAEKRGGRTNELSTNAFFQK